MSEPQPKSPSKPQESADDVLQDSFRRLQQAEQLRQVGRLDQAQAICEALLERHPNYWGTLHTLGLTLADKESHKEALDYLVRAQMLDPQNWMTLTALSGVYLRLDAIEMAARTIAQAMQIEPKDPSVLLMRADIYREDCEYELARDAYRQALAADPNLFAAAIGLGWCCAEIGDHAEAAGIFEDLIHRGMHVLEPLRALAAFPASVVHIDLLSRLDRVARDVGESEAEFSESLAFIRAIGLHRAGRTAEAWEEVKTANQKIALRAQKALTQSTERREASLAALNAFDGSSRGDTAAQPISLFVLGPSRSGKTTMERLIGTLAGVKRGYESRIIETTVRRTFDVSALPSDNRLEHLPAPGYQMCREIYREELAKRIGSARLFTNTNSGCVFVAAQIARIFENVRFVFVKRNFEDNLLQIYLRKYQIGNPYAYDLKAARDHLLWYNQMVDLMAAKFPAITRVVSYEDMLANPAGALRTAAELCGLPSPIGSLPPLDGDVGSAGPYREFIAAALRAP